MITGPAICGHEDAYGSTVIAGDETHPAPVCILCDAESPHRMRADCWCNPTISYEDPLSGERVFVHREIRS